MSKFPNKPQKGQPSIQAIYDSVCQIVDYLPSLEVRGDNKTTSVNHTSYGTTIHAIQNYSTTQTKQGQKYYAGSGIVITSGNIINAKLSAGPNIQINYNSGWLVISGTPAGSGGGPGPGSDTTYIGDGNEGSGHIFVAQTGESPRYISSDLYWIDDLVNYPLTGENFNGEQHFVQVKNLEDGAGTTFDYHWNSVGDHADTPDGHLIKWIDGVCVNLSVSGGQYIRGTFHQGVGYGDYTSASIDCILSGDNKYIFIGDVAQSDGLIGGIISTNLHGDGTTVTIDNDGTIHSVAGGTIVASGVQYPNYQELHKDDYGSVSGIGISFMLPVQSDCNVCFYTAAGSSHAYATFAASEMDEQEHYERATIYNGTPYQTSAAGWVRLSVFDDGTNEGECLRFTDHYSDSSSWNYSTPLYRFHGFKSLSADNNTIDITNNIISGKYYGDGTYIQVDGAQIKFIGTVGGGFKAPDFAKLQVANDAGIAASGMGTTYLVPVSKGSTVRYSADGGTIIARWAPVEGSSENAFAVTTTNKSTTDDGYVRISVIDDGTLSSGCVRLIVNNKELPLHKFARFNYSSGAIYEAGRYMQIQTTSTRVNPQTEQEESYTLENPIINNMLTGGRFITIQEEENNVELEYPRINCDLSEGTNIQITTGGVINCTLTGLDQLANTTTNYITSVDIPPSTTYIGESGIALSTILDENDQPTTSSIIYISASFYDTLTNPTNNTILSCNGGNLCWVQNTGGSTPTPTPGGGENIVYITAEGEYDLVANTHYFILLDPVLSGNQNYSAEDQQWYKIYKYMWYDKDTGENQGQTILTTTVRYENEYYNYGAYKTPGDPDSWMDYNEGGVFGAKLNFPVPTQTTHITITAFRNSNSIVCAPYGGIIWDWSNPQYYPLSGTTGLWFGQFLQRMQRKFIFDPATNRWYINSQ